jgi:hypothetical protein
MYSRRNIIWQQLLFGTDNAGTIRNTTGTTIGTNIANVGQVVMAQSVNVDIMMLRT